MLIGVTNCNTGKSEYLDGMKLDKKCTYLRATCAVPLMFPMIEIDGKSYYDGGIADPIPIRKSISDGNEKNLIVLTQPEGYIKETDRQMRFAARKVRKNYPELSETLLNRADKYNETVKYCLQLEKEGKAVVLRPKHMLNSMEKDVDALKKNNEMGYSIASERINEIKELFEI